ncbi:MAG TPA: filamentous hemagglutinin N-terminal domain-containing protein, partial [Burkholderiales bacterium]|nr:filamentous hemagglutinin N-terminal domain-containing protein [Burkholderiales bacterium]
MAWERKLLALAVASCFAGGLAHANPTGPQVVHGRASFSTVGNTLTIANTPGTVINWQSFSIASQEITRFLQQSAASAVLNRVITATPSAILGALQSNGRVFLINPAGITIGAGARIDTAGFVASSLNLSDADFLAGRYRFTETPGAAPVINQGTITTSAGGMVYLVGSSVENHGIIRTPQGEILLAAGKSIELVDAGTPEIRVQITAPDNQALNLGQLIAEGGRIGMYAGLIRHGGVANANTAVVGENGKIVFKAVKDVTLEEGSLASASGPSGGSVTVQAETGTLLASGVVEARGTEDKGGTIRLLGDRVGLVGNAVVDASGTSGGGTVLVGGDFQGKNPEIQNAWRTYVGPDAKIRADAIETGDGGRVIVWADDITRFYGTISARGGAQGGDG